jgi:hypothetical protein
MVEAFSMCLGGRGFRIGLEDGEVGEGIEGYLRGVG